MAAYTSFERNSYKIQAEHEKTKTHKIPNVIGAPDIIDAWRHNRIYDMVLPLCRAFSNKNWLTLGDSGADSFAIKRRGVSSVSASCLSAERLNYLQDKGLIKDIPIQELNAESTGKEDNSVDVVLVKEAYHHFPRPPIAFYEALRICKTAVVYIEPTSHGKRYALNILRRVVKSLVRKERGLEQEFEPAGNYIYRLSVDEVKHMAAAMQLPTVAYRYFNNFYVYSLAVKPTADSNALRIFKLGIAIQSILCRLKLMGWGMVVCVVFKEEPDQSVLRGLETEGYEVHNVPRNPYLT